VPEYFLPLDGRRRAVTIVFGAIVAISAAAVISDIAYLDIIDRIKAGANVSEAEAVAADDRQRTIGLFQLAGFAAAAIVFIRWLHGAYQNVDAVDPKERRWGHGWAIGGWFVPILNLWRPKQIVNDVWRAGSQNELDGQPGALLGFWWGAVILAGLFDRAAAGAFTDDSLEAGRRGATYFLIADGLDIIGAILAILVVRIATDRLKGRAAEQATPPEPEGPGPLEAPERPAGAPA
jgi:hypothetical protein